MLYTLRYAWTDASGKTHVSAYTNKKLTAIEVESLLNGPESPFNDHKWIIEEKGPDAVLVDVWAE